MITRPLDLASKLRREPRSLDWLFFVNGGLIVLFFFLFGSRFVLAPGLGLDFRLPQVAGANAQARATTHSITVLRSGLIITNDGLRKLEEFPEWLKQGAKGATAPSLLVRADENVVLAVLTEITDAASAAGFTVIMAAGEPTAAAKKGP